LENSNPQWKGNTRVLTFVVLVYFSQLCLKTASESLGCCTSGYLLFLCLL